ncbi:hypothetical protein QN222_22665 [Sinorhizobium sp. 6-70]|uniref:hypothetical protein n=1 Tax=Sinorhizobium sp. 6-70 TaxID=3049088 RepID=UPI0024C3FB09|nr:hypothetical protein [Sinorhizobium sp. 6-70]MDK1377282.1 hypothetical protein [Sinorhizobium sp. 6-70]MDK1481893.1 hypothetical protein [Sinorhizobium sp. 6-117]
MWDKHNEIAGNEILDDVSSGQSRPTNSFPKSSFGQIELCAKKVSPRAQALFLGATVARKTPHFPPSWPCCKTPRKLSLRATGRNLTLKARRRRCDTAAMEHEAEIES